MAAFKPDPKNPKDILGSPIEPGVFVVWPRSIGSSSGISIGRVERVNFKRLAPGSSYLWDKCQQHQAERFSLTLQPFATPSFGYTKPGEYLRQEDGGIRFIPSGDVKPVTVQNVENVVVLGFDDVPNLINQ